MGESSIGLNADKHRGLRLEKIVRKIFPKAASSRSRAMSLGLEPRKYARWEKGANIDNEALAAITRLGGDVVYILTGMNEDVRAISSHTAFSETELFSQFGECVSLLSQLTDLAHRNDAARGHWQDYLSDLRQTLLVTLEASRNCAQPSDRQVDAG